MATYHKWVVKNEFVYVLQFLSLISDGLGGVTSYTRKTNFKVRIAYCELHSFQDNQKANQKRLVLRLLTLKLQKLAFHNSKSNFFDYHIFLKILYLLEVKRIPLTPPKVDIATNMGTRKAKYPNTLSANVTATASLPKTSGTDKVV